VARHPDHVERGALLAVPGLELGLERLQEAGLAAASGPAEEDEPSLPARRLPGSRPQLLKLGLTPDR
jgi:hypothetical protein